MNLPVLFICENNNLAVHSFQKDRQSFNINEHANSYGIASEKILEGYDFLKIHERVKENLHLLIKEGSLGYWK